MTLVDGLRAIAALGVVGVHAGGFLRAGSNTPGDFLDVSVRWVQYGGCGVDIFFVLSGFVIAHSVGRADVTPRYAARFALRRSLRLDPPYWFSIFLILGVLAVRAKLGSGDLAWPAPQAVAAHFLYLQRILGYDHLMIVYWTLCLEVQFYLVFILLLMFARWLARASGRDPANVAAMLILAAFVVSLIWPARLLPVAVHMAEAWFPPQWHKFLIGAIVSYAAAGILRQRTAALCLAALTIAVSAQLWNDDGSDYIASAGLWVGLATAALLLLAVRLDMLYRWLNWRPLLVVGTISYSLYLIHTPVGIVLLAVQKRLVGDSPVGAICFFLLNAAAAIAAAWVMYQLVERPSLKAAAYFRPGGRRGARRGPEELAGGIEGPLPAAD